MDMRGVLAVGKVQKIKSPKKVEVRVGSDPDLNF